MQGVRRAVRAALSMGRRTEPDRPTRLVPEWSIAIYTGASALRLAPAAVAQPALSRSGITDADADFVADPFMIRARGDWYMFFEIYNRRTWRGEIGVATSPDARRWAYRGRVLVEPFHLSYPHVFEWQDEHYMVPESADAGCVRLYRADPFPMRWTADVKLVEGEYVDPTICRWNDRWWLFCARGQPPNRADELMLFHAPRLTGPWTPHPCNPIAQGAAASRPAGRIVETDAGLTRFAQDCAAGYGSGIRAFAILELDPHAYRETDLGSPIASPAEAWNAAGMHHVDVHRDEDGSCIACVDGHRFRPARPPEV